MAEFPAMPLFTDAYLGDTIHLSTLEHGAYLLLLMVAWRGGGSLPDDDRLLKRYAKLTTGQWERVKPVILDFFDRSDDGRLTQRRLTDEYNLVRRKRAAAAANGKASALKRKERHSTKRQRSANRASTPKPKPLPTEDSPNGESTPTPFAAPQPEWTYFAEHRKQSGKPLTEHAVKINLAKLERLAAEGNDPRAVLNQTIANGWTGLFEVKEDHRRGRQDEHPLGKTGAAMEAELNSSLLADLEENQGATLRRSNVVALPSPSRFTD